MAQIPRSLPPTVPANVTAARLPGAPRSVASIDAAPIEETTQQETVLFNDALLYQEERATDERRRRNAQPDIRVEYAGSAQAFAAMFEGVNGDGGGELVPRIRSRDGKTMIAKAINTYETNVRVIHGTADLRGTNLSMTL